MSPTTPLIPKQGHLAVIFRAAKQATRLLRDAGYTFAIMGSLACYLYGNERPPNDVDILISSRICDIEPLKRFLVAQNPDNFYLVDAKTPRARWKVLWYQDHGRDGNLERTKVDIMKPGTMQLPMIFSEAIVDKQGLPVVPLSILLLHKLRGWEDNMKSRKAYLRRKHNANVGDIGSLLRIVIEGMGKQEKKNSKRWKRFAQEQFSKIFQDGTKRRVKLFSERYPEYGDMWKELGW
ncbi:uncharacterized protein EV420DRAFT_695250 [Desarmillaria tabescens]|uniref:Nucleotidyltransferase n=1 Tax=Armillaria tabescens TaxID=1929756 RepID=A0AA39MZU6_ARMTA|nr:uncharacterized protein EV420DRAFT_695250 [Desarmillaria tabescens]KAK0452179.1 hypothetical protein EV420DRAFT_695250 [Desarmillaria tabescens]